MRTSEGAAQVSAGSDTLPRAPRSVLLAVDGRSSVARYEPFLLTLMPLDEKIVALEQLGLLRRKDNDTDGRVELTLPARTPETAEVALTDTTPVAPASDFESELQALSRQMGVIPDNSARRAGQGTASGSVDGVASLVDPADKAALTATVPRLQPDLWHNAGRASGLKTCWPIWRRFCRKRLVWTASRWPSWSRKSARLSSFALKCLFRAN